MHKEPHHRIGQGRRIATWNQGAGAPQAVAEHLFDAGGRRRDDGQTARHGLERRDGEALPTRRKDIEVRCAQKAADLDRIVDETVEPADVVDALLRHQAVQGRRARARPGQD